MSALFSTIGLAACVYLVSDSEPGSFWFVFGVVFGVLNLLALIRESA